MKKMFIKILSAILFVSLSFSLTSKVVHADAYKVVTLGADLSKEQKNQMLKYFDVSEKEANVLEVTKPEEDKYLGDVATAKQIGTKSISCSFVEPTSKGGLDIKTNNIYWVNENMIRNALITAGIENAKVVAAAPFNVSGTAALTGILKGFENSKGGEKISENKKKVANEEIVVTGEVGDSIGQDEAANLINEVKKEVVKTNPKDKDEVKQIVEDVSKDLGANLDNAATQKITNLMVNINNLNLNFDSIKGSLNDASNKLKDVVSSEEAQGFFAGVKNFFSSLFDSIGSLFN